MTMLVNVDNFARAETDRMFTALAADVGVNRFVHHREPASIDDQPVIRQNRDTLYSSAIVDISGGATLTIPDAGDRYLSVMVVNNDHYINDVLRTPGDHQLTVERYDTDYVLVAARILVDPNSSTDLDAVHALQDELVLDADSDRPFAMADYDTASFDATRQALLTLSRGMHAFTGAFGRKDAVDPVHHLIGTASGWGGLPEDEAFYLNVDPGFPEGEYQITVHDVPVDGFWSISVYNAAGYFERERTQRVQREQRHRDGEPRRVHHRQPRGLCRRSSQLPPHHGRLELRRTPLPTATRDPHRLLDVPNRREGGRITGALPRPTGQ